MNVTATLLLFMKESDNFPRSLKRVEVVGFSLILESGKPYFSTIPAVPTRNEWWEERLMVKSLLSRQEVSILIGQGKWEAAALEPFCHCPRGRRPWDVPWGRPRVGARGAVGGELLQNLPEETPATAGH